MKVHPEMLMKTKVGEKKVSGIRYQVSGRKAEFGSPKPTDHPSPARAVDSDSWLLAPHSCYSKMKVHPDMLMKIMKASVRYQVPGVRETVRSPGS
jgi:hypothetical protein